MDISILLQIVTTTIAIIVTYYAAIKGAERGARRTYELSEEATLARERREQIEQQKRQEEQLHAVRLLLALEIRQNLLELQWLWENIVGMLGEERELFYEQIESENDVERYAWLEDRQRFISLYMPDWSHRCWYNQQGSYLVSIALEQMEIRKINHHHSQLERLMKIKNMLTERALKREKDLVGDGSEALAASSSFSRDGLRLWKEFVKVSNEILEMGNPLSNALKKAGVGDTTEDIIHSEIATTTPQANIDGKTPLRLND